MATKRVVKKAVKTSPKKASAVVPEATYRNVLMLDKNEHPGYSYCATDAELLVAVEEFLRDNDVNEVLVYRLVPYKKYRTSGITEVFD